LTKLMKGLLTLKINNYCNTYDRSCWDFIMVEVRVP
jgi:hypothetical protein